MRKNGTKNHKRLYQLRRIAIQLADQLPEDRDEARLVLLFTRQVFEDFLTKGEFADAENSVGLAVVK
jgi:hypothetical protein